MSELPNQEILTGNITLLKQQIIERIQERVELENLPTGGGGGIEEDNSHPEFRNKIKIKLVFTGKTRTEKFKENEKSLRLVRENYKTIQYPRIKEYALKTYSSLNNLTISLGKIQYNYVRWLQGYQLQQMYCLNESEAQKWIEAILDIQGHSPDWDFLKNDAPSNPEGLFPEQPRHEVVAGIPIQSEQKRPYGSLTWKRAYIKFPKVPEYALLCNNKGYIIPNLNFLRNYEPIST